MTDPTRLIELEQATSALERRVLDAARSVAAPAGAKAAVLGAISSQVALSAGTAAVSSSLALVVKSVAAGIAIGVAATAGVSAWVSPGAAPRSVTPASSPSVVLPVAPGARAVESPTAPTTAPLLPAQKAEPPSRRLAERPALNSDSPAPLAPAAPSQMAFSDVPLATGRFGASSDERAQLESRRVAEARGLLRAGRADAALAVLNELARDFPGGVLAQEREALTVQALLGSGQREQARRLALAFLAAHPNSPLAASVRRALE